MAQERVEHRHAAILAADVVGYGRLVGMDEEGDIARFDVFREEINDPSIAKHRKRIVKTASDGILIEFASVANAVQCAVDIQRDMGRRVADVSEVEGKARQLEEFS